MPEKNLEKQKKNLVEQLGVHFEKEKNIPPLAARILSTLILNGKLGTTFEELVTELEAGKSTICNHLNSLIAQQRVAYFTKTGDRKRYFIIGNGYIANKIAQLVSHWETEIDLQKKVLAYKSDFNEKHPSKTLSLSFHQNALAFLNGAVDYFKQQANLYQLPEKTT